MEFIEFESLLGGIANGSIQRGFTFTHYNGEVDEEWEFPNGSILGTATPTPFSGGWWGEPYASQGFYLVGDNHLFLDCNSEGDGFDYSEYLGQFNDTAGLALEIAKNLTWTHVEMHFALSRHFNAELFPADFREIFEVAADCAWFRSNLSNDTLSQIDIELMRSNPVYEAFVDLFNSPADPKWTEILSTVKREHNLAIVYERFGPSYTTA